MQKSELHVAEIQVKAPYINGDIDPAVDGAIMHGRKINDSRIASGKIPWTAW
jgi:hypothetical protein